MSKIENQYFQDRFMGVPVKCDTSYPSITKILEALYLMVYECTNVYSRPRGYHVRVRFTEKMDSQKFSARISTFFKRKSGYIPLRLTVVEQDEDEEGVHYHYAVILNDRLDRKSSLQRLMNQLKDGGFLSDYKVIPPKIDPYGHHLRTLEERDSYFKWMSYLAKVETKAANRQVWSPGSVIGDAVKKWNLAGKPDLRKKLFDQAMKDSVTTVDILEFMQPFDISLTTIMPDAAPVALPEAI